MTLLDELTTGPLAQEIAPFLALSQDSKILEILNRKDIVSNGKVYTSDIKAFLFAAGFWNTIKHGSSMACEEAIDALTLFQEFHLDNPIYLSRLTQVLDALVLEPLIPDFTEEHKTIILSLGITLISRLDQIGLSVTENDIANARMEII